MLRQLHSKDILTFEDCNPSQFATIKNMNAECKVKYVHTATENLAYKAYGFFHNGFIPVYLVEVK